MAGHHENGEKRILFLSLLSGVGGGFLKYVFIYGDPKLTTVVWIQVTALPMHTHKKGSGLKLQYWFALLNLCMYSILKAWDSILETTVTATHIWKTQTGSEVF